MHERRQRSLRTEAVVLRQFRFGEADTLLTLFSRDMGKLRALAKGALRPGSRRSGHLDLFTRSDLLLARGREMAIITQAEALDSYRPLREDLARMAHVAYCVELLDRLTVEEGDSQPGLYGLLVDTIGRLAYTDKLLLPTRYFELRLLDLNGYRPELQHCVVTGEALEPVDQFFSAVDGGVVSPAGRPEAVNAWPISLAALKVLRHLQRSEYGAVQQLQLGQAVQDEVEQIMHRYISVILEQQPRSIAFIEQVRRLHHEARAARQAAAQTHDD